MLPLLDNVLKLYKYKFDIVFNIYYGIQEDCE